MQSKETSSYRGVSLAKKLLATHSTGNIVSVHVNTIPAG